MDKFFNIGVDIKNERIKVLEGIYPGDSVRMRMTLSDGGKRISFAGTQIIKLSVRKGDYTTVETAELLRELRGAEAENGIIETMLPESFVNDEGMHQLQLTLIGADGQAACARVNYIVYTSGANADASEDDLKTCGDLLKKAAEALDAEDVRITAEAARQTAEEERTAVEWDRVAAEDDRVVKEEIRAEREIEREDAEGERVIAEENRESAETERSNAEYERYLREKARAEDENARAAAEETREAADEAQLYGALKRLEEEIGIYGRLPEKAFSEDGELYAPEAFRNMYEEYLRSENALLAEDWDCHERHEAIFRTEMERLREYLVRSMPMRNQKFSLGEGWL